MEAHAGDGHVLVAASEGLTLFLADPLGEAIGFFAVVGMFLVDREIVVARLAAIGMPDSIDA